MDKQQTASRIIPHLRTFMRPAIEAGIVTRQDLNTALRKLREPDPAHDELTPPRLLRTHEVAERLNVCSKTVYRMADAGALTRVYLTPGAAKSLRFRESEVESLIFGQQQRIPVDELRRFAAGEGG